MNLLYEGLFASLDWKGKGSSTLHKLPKILRNKETQDLGKVNCGLGSMVFAWVCNFFVCPDEPSVILG